MKLYFYLCFIFCSYNLQAQGLAFNAQTGKSVREVNLLSERFKGQALFLPGKGYRPKGKRGLIIGGSLIALGIATHVADNALSWDPTPSPGSEPVPVHILANTLIVGGVVTVIVSGLVYIVNRKKAVGARFSIFTENNLSGIAYTF